MPLSSPPTPGNDIITMTGTEATVDLLAGDDTFTVDTGDEVTGNVIMGLGADTFNILDGIINQLHLGVLGGGVDTDTNTANLDGGTITTNVRGGIGTDVININGVTIGGSIVAEDGDDEVTMTSGLVSSDIGLQDGDDTMVMSGGTVDGFVALGAGADSFTMTGGTINQLYTAISSSTADTDTDTIDISGGTVTVGITGSSGIDNVTLRGTAATGTVRLDEGDDTITLSDDVIVTGNVSAQGGDDTVDISGAAEITGNMGLGTGDDTFTMSGGSIGGTLGLGSSSSNGGTDGGSINTVTITGGTIGVNIVGTAGTDNVTLAAGVMVGGTIRVGNEDDTVVLNGATVGLDVNLGGGDDDFIMTDGTVNRSVITGTGDDSVTLSDDASVGSSISTDAGNDSVDISGTVNVVNNVRLGTGDDTFTMSGGEIGMLLLGNSTTSQSGDAGSINTATITGGMIGNRIRGTEGRDEITVQNAASVGGSILTGDANDSVTLADTASIGGAVNLGSGDDTFDLSGMASVDSTVATGLGDDTFTMSGGTISGVVSLGGSTSTAETDAGSINTANISGGSITGDLLGTLGVDNITISGAATVDGIINADAGDDILDFSGATARAISFADQPGEGNDIIIGSALDDEIRDSIDSDTVTGGAGNDTFRWDADAGAHDTITDFGFGNTGTVNDGDINNNDVIDLSGKYNATTLAAYNAANGTNFAMAISALRHDIADGVLNFDGTDMTSSSMTMTGVVADDLTFESTRVVCFAAGTRIETDKGLVPVEDIRAGDQVRTLDHGLQPVRWIGSDTVGHRELTKHPNLRPIRIAAGALGNGLPVQDLYVSRQHRVLVQSKIAERMFGTDEVLVAAIKLVVLPGIDICNEVDEVEYFHLLCNRHEVLVAEGAPLESLLKGPDALKALTPEARSEIEELFPGTLDGSSTLKPARTIPAGSKAKQLARRLFKNRKKVCRRPSQTGGWIWAHKPDVSGLVKDDDVPSLPPTAIHTQPTHQSAERSRDLPALHAGFDDLGSGSV